MENERVYIYLDLCVCLPHFPSYSFPQFKSEYWEDGLLAYPHYFLCSMCSDQQMLYYPVFIVIFQFGWAAVQISHLSLITDLTSRTFFSPLMILIKSVQMMRTPGRCWPQWGTASRWSPTSWSTSQHGYSLASGTPASRWDTGTLRSSGETKIYSLID